MIAFVFSYLATPVAARLARLVGAIDLPDGARKLHSVPMPRLGGVGIYLSYFAYTLIFGGIDGLTAALLIGGGVATFIGALDDVFNYNARKKLSLGAMLSLFTALVMTQGESLSYAEYFARVVGHSLFILLLINAFNMVDGSDGLSATLALVSLLFMSAECAAAGVLFFSVLGFLPHNIPAKIYLGESGACLLGYFLALTFLYSAVPVSAIFTLTVPIFEVVISILRRAAVGRHPFSADRGHMHHRLLSLGVGDAGVAATLSVLAVAVSVLAVLLG